MQKAFLPEPELPGEPGAQNRNNGRKLWDKLLSILPDARERRLAYLLYPCGLKPEEIAQCYPQEWSDIQEIHRLRHSILERVLQHTDLPG